MTHIQSLLAKAIDMLDNESPDTNSVSILLEQLQEEMEGKVAVDFTLFCKTISNPFDDESRWKFGESVKHSFDDVEDYRKMSRAFQSNMLMTKGDN